MPIDSKHDLWSAFLERFVQEGRVDYAAIRAEGMGQLEAYLTHLKQMDRASYNAMSRADQLAFWLNSYNAYAIKTVVEKLPIDSIQALDKPFEQPIVDLPELEAASLDTIEHDIVRAQFDDPRVHFALVCTARGCPSLRSTAYTGENLDAQLEEQTEKFLRDTSKNRFEGDSLLLSKIFEWYADDFTDVRAFLARYLGDDVRDRDIRYLDYDWSLNSRAYPPNG